MAFARRLAILRMLPRRPRRMSTAEVFRRLQDIGFEAELRTVQRDLDMLSGLAGLPVVCDDRAKNNLAWYWDSEEVFDLAMMDAPTALTFALMDDHLAPLLPPLVREHLAPHVRHAQALLDAADDNVLRTWTDRVRVKPRGQRQIGPKIDGAIADVIYDALLRGRQFSGVYAARFSESPDSPRRFHPLGLVLRDQLAYLVAMAEPHEEPVYLALHRFRSVEATDDPVVAPNGFDLDAHLAQKSLDFIVGDPIRFEFLIDAMAATHLAECPLGSDQVIEDQRGDRKRVTVTVEDTEQLRWWILGYGDRIEAVAPEHLRSEIAEALGRAVDRYR